MESFGLFRIVESPSGKFLALKEVKRFYGPLPILLVSNLKCFLGFLSYFSVVVCKNVLTMFQNLARVMRQRECTLMAKLADFPRLDKAL